MKHYRSALAWAAALALLLCLFSSCAAKPESPGSTAAKTEPAPVSTDSAQAAAWAVYTAAAEKTAGLKSEKLQSDISLTFSLIFADKTVKSTERQLSTQIFADSGGEVLDFCSETATARTAEETSESSVVNSTLWVKDGVAYLLQGDSRTRTEDLDSLGLESLRTGIHSGFLYRIPAEAVTEAETEKGAASVTAAGTGEALREGALEVLRSLRVLELFFGSVLEPEQETALLEAMELTDASFAVTTEENGYFASTETHLNCRFPISGELQSKVLGGALADEVSLVLTVDRLETFLEPGTDYTVGLPEDPELYREASAPEGAASLEELTNLLKEDLLFTERQVNCMSQEFLLACIYTCDPVNAVSIYEARDTAAIAALLNEKFFAVTGNRAVKYAVSDHADYTVTDEMRQQTRESFQKSYDQVVARYGAWFAQRVLEENEGRQAIIFPTYITADRNGRPGQGPENPSNGLYFSVVNGRYFWNDFSLFQPVSEEG